MINGSNLNDTIIEKANVVQVEYEFGRFSASTFMLVMIGGILSNPWLICWISSVTQINDKITIAGKYGARINNAITDGGVAPLTMLLTIVKMYHKILGF